MKLSLDTNSSPMLTKLLKKAATELGLSDNIGKKTQTIEDDHVPFKKIGIEVINLIDFNNIIHWHVPSDTLETLSLRQIENASKLALHIHYQISSRY